jgi:hypothetical protein
VCLERVDARVWDEEALLGGFSRDPSMGRKGLFLSSIPILPWGEEYCLDFEFSMDEIMRKRFRKLTPQSSRPYGRLYAY